MERLKRDEVKEIVAETIRQLKREGLLKSAKDIAYHEISARLRQYYRDGETDTEVSEALKRIEGDDYYKILPLYFRYGYTIEAIAETLGVEVSTIVRNKKRISIRIYELLED